MSNDKNAQELLKWGLANSTAVTSGPSLEEISKDIEAGRRPDLADPHLYDAIMGKSEAQMMRQELSVAVDTTRTVDDRCTALDNFEMLIEQIDNANNMTSIKMWEPIIGLLSAAEDPIRVAAAWIVGTAVQNNDKAQMAVLDYGVVQALVEMLHSGSEEVRAKAMYALSGVLKHNPKAMEEFHRIEGWKVLRAALVDPNIGVRRKTAFLVNALLFQDPNDFDHIPTSSSSSSLNTTSTSTATAVATAVAPVPNSGRTAAAPLETGPATLSTSAVHPNVARALLASGILTTLISSLLPPSSPLVSTDSIPPSGPDGDNDPRTDLDFAEKAATAILTFSSKLPSDTNLDPNTTALFKALLNELVGKPMHPQDGASSRWQELGVDADNFSQFKSKVQSW